jgi:hypothetical protein
MPLALSGSPIIKRMPGRGSIGALLSTVAMLATTQATSPGAAPLDSGVRGKVLYGPTCPVERPGERCVRPYEATLRIRQRATHKLVATVRSADDGRFRVRLAPGRYVIVPVSGRPYPQASPQRVRVRRHEFTRVTIRFDSGIR